MSEALEITDFSGGVTDYPLNAQLNKAEVADNLLLEQQGGVSRYVLRPGSDYINQTYPQIPEGLQRISSLCMLGKYLLVHTSSKIYYIDPAGNNPFLDTQLYGGPWNGSDANRTLTMARFSSDGMILASYQQYPVMAYLTATVPKTQTAGLPLPSTPTPAITAGANNWLYKFVNRKDVVIGSASYTLLSAPTAALQTLNAASVNFSAVPTTYTNLSDTFFPTNPQVEVYRTIHNGTVFYFEGVVTNPTTTFLSTMSDATLQTQKRLYTEGGVQPNTKPPYASIVHTNGDVTYYAGVLAEPNTVYQSIPGIHWGVPTSFNGLTDDNIVGVSSVSGVTVVCCKNKTYRIDGRFDSFGRGGMSLQIISDTASCVSAQSLVQTEDALYWAGANGIFSCDGYRVTRINEDYDKTWSKMINKTRSSYSAANRTGLGRIQGKYDAQNKRVYWTLQRGEFGTDCDILYVLDTRYGISKNSAFTTMSGGYFSPDTNFTSGWADYFSATAVEFYPEYDNNDYHGAMFRADKRGIVHVHPVNSIFNSASNLTYDRAYTVLGVPSLSESLYAGIPYSYISPSFNFGSSASRKWVPRLNLNLDYTKASTSNIRADMKIFSINDAGKVETQLDSLSQPVVTLTNSHNYSFASKWRHFARTALRCVFKQIKFQPENITLQTSEPGNLASVAGNIVTLGVGIYDTVTAYSKIYFADDNYTTGYLIVNAGFPGSNLQTLTSPPGGSGKSWKIKGVSKNVLFPVLSYNIHFTTLRDSNQAFAPSEAQT